MECVLITNLFTKEVRKTADKEYIATLDFPNIIGISMRQKDYAEMLRREYVEENKEIFEEIAKRKFLNKEINISDYKIDLLLSSDNAYEIIELLRGHFKEINSRPTLNQFRYAQGIADALELKLPEDLSRKSITDFINKYRQDFSKAISDDEKKWNLECLTKYGFDISEYSLNEMVNKKGLYAFCDSKGKPLYIGKGVSSLGKRIPSSFKERSHCKDIYEVRYFEMNNDPDIDVLEIILINKYHPKLNTDCNRSGKKNILFKTDISVKKDFKLLSKRSV